jgi:DNA-binding XRE family transcriptional regulator
MTTRLGQLRDRLGLGNRELAALLGVDARSVRRWSAGDHEPVGTTAVLIDALLAVLRDADKRCDGEAVAKDIVDANRVGGLGLVVYRALLR